MRALALAAHAAVIARQGFASPAAPSQVAELLAGISGVQDPTSSAKAPASIATHVLDGLTNQRDRARQFTLERILYKAGNDGAVMAARVPRPFWLLRELEDLATGEVYLRACVCGQRPDRRAGPARRGGSSRVTDARDVAKGASVSAASGMNGSIVVQTCYAGSKMRIGALTAA